MNLNAQTAVLGYGRMVTATEAARMLSICPERVRQLIRQGRLPAIKWGGRSYMIKESDLLRALSLRHQAGQWPDAK